MMKGREKGKGTGEKNSGSVQGKEYQKQGGKATIQFPEIMNSRKWYKTDKTEKKKKSRMNKDRMRIK